MKLVGIILPGILGLSSIALTGDAINKGQEHMRGLGEQRQKTEYMCPMMETDSMREMKERCMQGYSMRGREMQCNHSQEHKMYRRCM